MEIVRKKDKLTVFFSDSTEEMARKSAKAVAGRILSLLKQKDTINMIFAAAPSQSAFLDQLISYKEIPWDRINALHMDEYIGLDESAPQRFGNFLKQALFSRVNFRNVFYLDGNNLEDGECERYATLLAQYPPDIVCLGIGENGHIAFNDPHVAFFDDAAVVKPVTLDEVCRRQQVDDKCFSRIEDVPTRALTLTIPTLLRGTYMYCIVPFKTKAEAVLRTLSGPVSETCPASVLRTRDGTYLYLDPDSASLVDADHL